MSPLKTILFSTLMLVMFTTSGQDKGKSTLESRLVPYYSRFSLIHTKDDYFIPPNYASNMVGLSYLIGKRANQFYMYTGISGVLKFRRASYIEEYDNGTLYLHPDVDRFLNEASIENKEILEIPIGVEFNLKNDPLAFDLRFTFRHWFPNSENKSDPFSPKFEALMRLALKYRINDKLNLETHIQGGISEIHSNGGIRKNYAPTIETIGVRSWTMSMGIGMEFKFLKQRQ